VDNSHFKPLFRHSFLFWALYEAHKSLFRAGFTSCSTLRSPLGKRAIYVEVSLRHEYFSKIYPEPDNADKKHYHKDEEEFVFLHDCPSVRFLCNKSCAFELSAD